MVCVRHPERPTGLTCTRCERPACPDCLREASVGYQCVDCVAQGARTQRRATTVAGAEFRNTRPVVVLTLIAINVVVFAITAVQAGSIPFNYDSALFAQWGLWPPAVAGGEFWRLLSAGFLHYGPLHLAFNMVALFVIGRDLEPVFGRARFVAVYLVSLLGGSAAVFVLGSPGEVVAGASGAVFGLMGALAVMLLRLRLSPGPALTVIGLNVVISIAVPQISLLGHLGGLVVGAVAAAAVVYAPQQRRTALQVGALAGLVVLLGVLIAGRDAQYGDVRDCRTEPELVCQVGPPR